MFVAAVGQLANALAAQPTTGRFFEFLGLFVPVWWVWMGFTFYANRFDTDDLPYRLLTLLGMFAVAVLATTVPGAFRGAVVGFPLAYVGARLVLLTLYARARRHVAEARALTSTFLFAFGAAVVVWLVSLAIPRPWSYVAWGGALAWILCAGLAMTMVGFAIVELVTPPRTFDADVVLRTATAALALVLIPLGASPLTALVVLAAVLVAQVAYELARREAHTHEASI